MMAVRTLLAAAVLLGYLAWRLGWTRRWPTCARPGATALVLGVLNAASRSG